MNKIVFENPNALANFFANELVTLSANKQRVNIALSGGATPKLLFHILATDYAHIDWSNMHFFWGDERCVLPTDDESNYKIANQLFFNHCNIPPENIHRVSGEKNPDEEALQYGDFLNRELPLIDGLPCFDLIYLGMGEDGHTASIFPHQLELLSATQTCAVSQHPISGQYRITLTGPVINNARKVIFLVTGKAKYPIIKSILIDEKDSGNYPAAHIKPAHGELKWYLDHDAFHGS